MTDAAGSFTLAGTECKRHTSVLIYRICHSDCCSWRGRTTLAIALTSDVAQLREVVVVGYGTQLKKDLTGSVTRVDAERLLDKPAFNVAQAIGGKIAGVKIIEWQTVQPGGDTVYHAYPWYKLNKSTITLSLLLTV